MENKPLTTVELILNELDTLVPLYGENIDDRSIANCNVAVVIIEENGKVTGKIYGENKVRGRESFRVAWTKASQVWITGMKTGEYERKLFNNEIGEMGISMPELIGWEGGQPVKLKDGTKLSAGFSGYRGVTDLEIVLKAVEKAGL